MTMAEILADIEWQSGESTAPVSTEFPEGFQGPGPMYAAIPVGAPWGEAALNGATTFILEDPNPTGLTAEQANADYDAYTGWSAFLDRGQAEQLADHPARDGIFVRYEGLTGYNDLSAKADADFRAFDAEMNAGIDSLEAGS
jgi:hypothetical protein